MATGDEVRKGRVRGRGSRNNKPVKKAGQGGGRGGGKKEAPLKAGAGKAKKQGPRGGRNNTRGGRGGRGGRGRSGDRQAKKPTAEDLDKSMDEYWLKSGDKELASKKLNDDLDEYWATKKEAQEVDDAAKERAGVADGEKAEGTADAS